MKKGTIFRDSVHVTPRLLSIVNSLINSYLAAEDFNLVGALLPYFPFGKYKAT